MRHPFRRCLELSLSPPPNYSLVSTSDPAHTCFPLRLPRFGDWSAHRGSGKGRMKASLTWWSFADRGIAPDDLIHAVAGTGYDGLELAEEALWPAIAEAGLANVSHRAQITIGSKRRSWPTSNLPGAETFRCSSASAATGRDSLTRPVSRTRLGDCRA